MKKQTMIKFQGGGATRNKAPERDLTLYDSEAAELSKNLKGCLEFSDNKFLRHSKPAEKSVETESKRDFMPLPDALESVNVCRNNLRHANHCDKSSRKAAFTLAEVLITLGIIGIVAAMTLPSLIGKWQEKVLEARFRKVYNILNVACEKTVADLGYVPSCYGWIPGEKPYPDLECERQENGDCIWVYPDGDKPEDYSGPRNPGDCQVFEEALMKNLNVIQQCRDAEDDGCTVHYKGSDTIMRENDDTLSDEDIMAATAATTAFREERLNKLPAIVLVDGTTFIDPMESRYINTIPIIDINGKRGPNKWGYDLFAFYRVGSPKKGMFYMAGSHPVEKGGRTSEEMIEYILKR